MFHFYPTFLSVRFSGDLSLVLFFLCLQELVDCYLQYILTCTCPALISPLPFQSHCPNCLFDFPKAVTCPSPQIEHTVTWSYHTSSFQLLYFTPREPIFIKLLSPAESQQDSLTFSSFTFLIFISNVPSPIMFSQICSFLFVLPYRGPH